MSYYLEVPNVTNRSVTVDIPAPTDASGYNFEIEFEVRLTSNELIMCATLPASATDIIFIKPTLIEYRRAGNTNISMPHGVNHQVWNIFRFVFTGTGQGNIAFYVNGVFQANYTPSSNVDTPAYAAILSFPSPTRIGEFRYFKFTDFNNTANNRMYDARAHTPGDTVLQETANNSDGTFNTSWAALPPNFVADGPVTTDYTITAETVTDTHSAADVTLIYAGSAVAYSITCDTVTDTHSAGDVTLTYSAAGAAAITSEPLKDNTGATLASQALDYVAIYDNTTGALVLRVTGISTNASGVFTVSDAALTAGVTYKLDWKVTAQSAARMPAKAAV